MGDGVVQLARDSRTLLDDRFACREITLAFGEQEPTVAVPQNLANEHHHDECDGRNRHPARCLRELPEERQQIRDPEKRCTRWKRVVQTVMRDTQSHIIDVQIT